MSASTGVSVGASETTHSLHLEALDVVVTLEVTGERLARAVAAAWHDATIDPLPDDPRPRRTLKVAASVPDDGSVDVIGADVATVLHRLSPAVTLAAIDARAGDLVLMHAAALADPRTGTTAVLVAASGTGKTTACRALAQELVYLSDETAGVDPRGRVARYRKPLSIVEDGPLKAQVSPSALGLRLDCVDGQVGAILHLERDPGHVGDPVIEVVDTIDALALLAPQVSGLARTHRPLHRLAELCESVGGVRRVRYAEADTLLPLVRALLAEHSEDRTAR